LYFTERGHVHGLPKGDKLIFFAELVFLLSKGHILLLLSVHRQNKLAYTYNLVVIKAKVSFGIKQLLSEKEKKK
jgi:hypothetical protein